MKSASKISSKSDDKPADDLVNWESGRKARLANLASTFKNYDAEEEHYAQREIQLPKPVTKPLPRAPNQFILPQTTAKSPTKASDNVRKPRKPRKDKTKGEKFTGAQGSNEVDDESVMEVIKITQNDRY